MKSLKNGLIVLSVLLFQSNAFGQDTLQYSDIKGIHARGLLLVKDKLYVGTNTGAIFSIKKDKVKQIMPVNKYKEIRDLSFVNGKLIAMSSGDSSALLFFKRDRLKSVEKQLFEGVFLDGLDSKNDVLFMMGDPNQKGDLSLFYSINGGKNIHPVNQKVHALKNEAAFAASGTTVFVEDRNNWFFVTGGEASRLIQTHDGGFSWTINEIPFPSCLSCGPYSVAKINDSTFVTVGGDYLKAEDGVSSCFWTQDGGKTWQESDTEVGGYRSCIYLKNDVLYACGTNGLDYSTDNGKNWVSMSKGNFLSMISDDKQLIVSASEGKIIRFNLIK